MGRHRSRGQRYRRHFCPCETVLGDAGEIKEIFGSGENVAVFGSFTYKSTKLGKFITSPFAVFSKVVGGKVTYMQFMEDTFGTSSSFRSKGVWHFESDPDGGEVTVGADAA